MFRKSLVYFLFVANLLVIIFIWWTGSSSLFLSGHKSSILISLGRLVGLLAEYLILVQLVIIGRISFVEQLWGHNIMNKIHRGIGYFLAIFILLHPLLLTFGYSYLNEVSLLSQFRDFVNNWHYVFLAFTGLLLFLVAVFLSFPTPRKKVKYETWHFTHFLMYVFIGFIITHQIQTADVSSGATLYYWMILNFVVFGLMLGYRWGRPFYKFFKHRFYVEKVVSETLSSYSIYIGGRKMDEFKFKPGHHANFTFLDKKLWYTHPFSFSADFNGKNIRITAKKLGDFTTPLSTVPVDTKVIIDGPLGHFIETDQSKNKYLFIAGGVGITPVRALIESLASKNKDIILFYGNRFSNDVIFKDELSKFGSKNYVVYSDEKVEGSEFGRIDEEKIKRLVPDLLEREIYVCGPPPMLKGLLLILEKLGVSKKQIHTEIF